MYCGHDPKVWFARKLGMKRVSKEQCTKGINSKMKKAELCIESDTPKGDVKSQRKLISQIADSHTRVIMSKHRMLGPVSAKMRSDIRNLEEVTHRIYRIRINCLAFRRRELLGCLGCGFLDQW